MSVTEDIKRFATEVATGILRTNATRIFNTKCTACGNPQTQSLSWLHIKRFICPSCGGKLDDQPLRQLTLAAMRKLRRSTKPPKSNAVKLAKAATGVKLDPAARYQLVLQFRGDSLQDFEAMVALEDELIVHLGDSADVDGHDIGSGEYNIFIFTSDPAAAFGRARTVLQQRQLNTFTAAYREVEGDRYKVLWPEGSQEEFKVT